LRLSIHRDAHDQSGRFRSQLRFGDELRHGFLQPRGSLGETPREEQDEKDEESAVHAEASRDFFDERSR
jgi:hypothetical protein